MAEKLKLEDAQVGETIGPYRYRVTPGDGGVCRLQGDVEQFSVFRG